MRQTSIALLLTAAYALAPAPAHAESIKVGISKLIGYPGVPIAVERGYFKEQGLDAEMVYFDSAQPIAVAVASGDVQFGTAGMSAGFYTLAAGGQLRMIASSAGDAPGSIGGAAKRYGFTMSDIVVKPLQSNTNVIAALTGNTVDAAVMPGSPILPPLQKGDIKLLSWVADVAPNPVGSATFTSTKEANEHGDTVKRFLVAYRQGMKDFASAFMSADGKRQDGPTAPAILDLMAKFTGVAPTEIAKAIPYVDPEGRVDAGAVADQIAWYKSQGLLKGEVDAHQLIDSRYALTKMAGK